MEITRCSCGSEVHIRIGADEIPYRHQPGALPAGIMCIKCCTISNLTRSGVTISEPKSAEKLLDELIESVNHPKRRCALSRKGP